jgi:hypothetical protein
MLHSPHWIGGVKNKQTQVVSTVLCYRFVHPDVGNWIGSAGKLSFRASGDGVEETNSPSMIQRSSPG